MRSAFPIIALASLLISLGWSEQLQAQPRFPIPWGTFKPGHLPLLPAPVAGDTLSFYKRKPDWKKIVDAYWGTGVPVQEKRDIFNAYADYIERYCTVFEGLGVSWDSLRGHYYSQITDSTSHGRFAAILSYLAYHLREPHVMALIPSLHCHVVGGDTVDFRANPPRGTPLWYKTTTPDARHFGAVLTPQKDSSAIVIRAAENHPLGLKRGDVVLGYEGIPWRQIARELLTAEIPSMGLYGGSRTMETHHLLASAGYNWHLFDTIDIVKSPGGDTLHLPVDTLASFRMIDTLYNNESLDVPGVPWPDWSWGWGLSRDNVRPVSHGIVQGTNTGYIYVAQHRSRERGDPSPDSEERFAQAIEELWDTDGLIIDLREDQGGWVEANFNRGFSRLMNFDTHTLSYWRRASASDLTALEPWPANFGFDVAGMSIDADEETVYDKPIAVLVGPGCVSMGDATAYRLTYIPNTRFFGKSTSMGMAGNNWTDQAPQYSGYEMFASDVALRDYYVPSWDLERTEFPVDERVWLTPEDVTKGEDTVVKRALAWIRSVPHAHHIVASRRSLAPGVDTLRLACRVANPQAHALSVNAYVRRDATVMDSVALADDGLHGDGALGDGLWGALWKPPAEECFYSAAILVSDPADPSTFPMPYAARFTTAGPVTIDSVAWRMGRPGQLRITLALRNHGRGAVVPSVQLKVASLDTSRYSFVTDTIGFGEIGPGEVARRIDGLTLFLRDPSYAGEKVIEVAIKSGEVAYWHETLVITGAGSPEVAEVLPVRYALGQNYPNPFNPTTRIPYALPSASTVRLAVYDLLGREVACLVDQRQMPGSYEVEWDASDVAAGVYLFRLTAGPFVTTRKMILVR